MTYNAEGKLTGKITYHPSTGIEKQQESFDEREILTDLSEGNIDDGYHAEGSQIRTLDGETTWYTLKNGVLEGAIKKPSKWGESHISRIFQKGGGKPVGHRPAP